MRRRMLPGLAVLYLLVALGGAFAQTSAAPSTVDRDAVFAREEFRLGIQAYNRFAFNESILSFEKALSFKPSEPLILEWLGRAYYRSGLEDTALRQWQSALGSYDPASDPALQLSARIETVRNRRSLFPELDEFARYVESGVYPGRNGDIVLYRQPTAVLPAEEGSVWVVAYGSNEILRIDVNGVIRQRQRGPLNGFDRPYDTARGPDGRLYVSEYRGGRVSVLNSRGEWQSYLGSKGLGKGQFVGPQNLAVDEDGYVYVVDYGNRRVSKFSSGGEHLLDFGPGTPGFRGFSSPTGIAVRSGSVYVADGATKAIHTFDRNGNYLGRLPAEGLTGPESLRFTPEGKLLIADTKRIVLLDPETSLLRDLGSLGNANSRIVGADTDGNGHIVAANALAGEVSVMARMDDISAGLFVQVERVVSDRFPEVTLELQVQDRRRRPVVGLEALNFLLTEEGRPVSEQSFQGAASRSSGTAVSILVERSPATASRTEDILAAVKDASSAVGGVTSLVSAGEQPLREATPSAAQLAQAALGKASQYSSRWNFDSGLRLAATDLLPGVKKRAVVFVGSGRLGERAFGRYGLSELASYLANNDVRFYAVLLDDRPAQGELSYLCEQTGGAVLSLYRPEGIGAVLRRLSSAASGSYTLRYRSGLPTDFGRAFLPVEAEVYLLNRSGRDGVGYFPPLE